MVKRSSVLAEARRTIVREGKHKLRLSSSAHASPISPLIARLPGFLGKFAGLHQSANAVVGNDSEARSSVTAASADAVAACRAGRVS